MAKLSQQTIADTRKTEQINAQRQGEFTPPLPQDSGHLDHSVETAGTTIDPFDHSVKDLEKPVPSAKK